MDELFSLSLILANSSSQFNLVLTLSVSSFSHLWDYTYSQNSDYLWLVINTEFSCEVDISVCKWSIWRSLLELGLFFLHHNMLFVVDNKPLNSFLMAE